MESGGACSWSHSPGPDPAGLHGLWQGLWVLGEEALESFEQVNDAL